MDTGDDDDALKSAEPTFQHYEKETAVFGRLYDTFLKAPGFFRLKEVDGKVLSSEDPVIQNLLAQLGEVRGFFHVSVVNSPS